MTEQGYQRPKRRIDSLVGIARRAPVALHLRYQQRTDPIGYARRIGVRLGDRCRLIGVSGSTFGSEPYLIRLGDHVVVAAEVRFVTHDGAVWVLRDDHPEADVVAPIIVGSNVFIGLGALIMPGVTIGDDVVIGARALVNRDVPAGSVVAGVPARVVGSCADFRARTLAASVGTGRLPEQEKHRRLQELFEHS
ncbi:acyltransferase [Parafrankia sp. EUN1f]|uniref:acyltransferase n=1 Tax=Parafrankia sp. EUN1f TaxID=102897 RepID=UPI0001C44605|nr:acyltransferase [Parafrankia sp. EUN1f]EFC85851.1 transferase hexapeptide repeat containing protein [Parafrankia sp. EUN1f]